MSTLVFLPGASPTAVSQIANRIAAPVNPSFEPIVISFSESEKQSRLSPSFPVWQIASLVLAALLAVLTGFLLWSYIDAKHIPAPATLTAQSSTPLLAATPLLVPAPAQSLPPQKNISVAEPPANAFNAHIIPLPGKAIMGRDFYAAKQNEAASIEPLPSAQMVDIVPLLAKLPLAKQAPARTNKGFAIDVDDETPRRDTLTLADEAALNGEHSKALALYIRALKQNPASDKARHNVVALLLDQAADFDEADKPLKAIAAYNRALAFMRKDDPMAENIHARIAYLKAS